MGSRTRQLDLVTLREHGTAVGTRSEPEVPLDPDRHESRQVVGLDAVSASVVDAACGVGYGRRQLLWRVQVPLATPTILAGIRIATVSRVGLVTIGALVGHGGFGTVILGGFVNNFYHAQILAGTIAVVVMALLLEGLLILLERLLTPWTRVKGSW